MDELMIPDPYATARSRYGDHKKCGPCDTPHPIEEFTIKDRVKGLLQSRCKLAVRQYGKRWYQDNRRRHIRSVAATNRRAYAAGKDELKAFLASMQCASCGCADDLTVALDLLPAATPRSLLSRGWSWERLEPLITAAAAEGGVFCQFCIRRRVC